jgi:hypothetical protein
VFPIPHGGSSSGGGLRSGGPPGPRSPGGGGPLPPSIRSQLNALKGSTAVKAPPGSPAFPFPTKARPEKLTVYEKALLGQLRAPKAGGTIYHYTTADAARSIRRDGLKPGSYATPHGSLSPTQAHLDLSLSPTGGRNVKLKIDVRAMKKANLPIPPITKVRRDFNMPGSEGYEMKFDYAIPPWFIKVVEE